MKSTAKKLASLLALVLVFVMTFAPVCAYADSAYTEISGTTTTFNKYLVVSSDANIPAAEFSFTVSAPESKIDGDATHLPVIPGPTPASVIVGTAGKVSFSAGAATTAGTATDGIANDTAKKYATAEVTVDLTAVKFQEPGVYRYIITEAASSDPFTNDATTTRTLDVYVIDTDGALSVQKNYVMYSGTKTDAPLAAGGEVTGKSDQFVNSFATNNLSLTKTVSGNQGSKDKYFKFTLTINGAGAGTIVNISTDNACDYLKTPPQTEYTAYTADVMAAANNVTTLTANDSGVISHDFYLSHNDTVIITGIPTTTTYTITEKAEEYTSTVESGSLTGNFGSTVSVTVNNERTGTIPTGVMLTVIPGAVIVLVAVTGLVLISRKKKNEE